MIEHEKASYFDSRFFLLIQTLIFFLVCNSNIILAQGVIEQTKVIASNRTAGDWFGNSVAIDGNYAIVGVEFSDTDPGDDNGAAFLYKRNSNNQWVFLKKLVASDQQSYGYEGYGGAVAINGDYIAVGSQYTLTYNGAVYIYKKDQGGTDNWGEIKKVEATVGNFSDYFGTAISMDGDYLAVGAWSEDEDANDANNLNASGSAYIFKKNQGGADNWGQVKKIVASDRAASDFFGTSISISGDYVVVGAPYEDEDASGANNLNASGSAYIFKKDQGGADNWGQIKKIVASDRNVDDQFGGSVSIDGDYIVVGASYEDEDADGLNNIGQSGSAYIFKMSQGGADNWGQIKKITANVREGESYFGYSLDIYGDYILVGEAWSSFDENNQNVLNAAGAAYILKKDFGGTDNWGQFKKIVHSDRQADDAFGSVVAISNDYLFILAENQDYDLDGNNFLNNAGAGYIFQFIPVVTTSSVSNILTETAESGGNVEVTTHLTIASRGVVWSTSQNPTISLTSKTENNSGAGTFQSLLSAMTHTSTYYVRAYATTDKGGTAYGNEIMFLTKTPIFIDGNQDGIADTLQDAVETFYDANSESYITIESVNGEKLNELEHLNASETNFVYPYGMFSFKINASFATVKLYLHGNTDLSSYVYRKIDSDGNYYNFENAVFSHETLLGVQTATVTLTLVDGQAGDYDGIVNGVIYDPGGPAISATAINAPIWDDFWRIFVIAGLVIIPIFWLRRRA